MPITINGTTGISGVDGTAGTPAVIGSDADTGLVFAAGRVSASLNGTVANVGLVLDTVKTATGTSVDFTGIPSWVKRVTVMFNGVSTNGTSQIEVRLGTSGGFEATGYASGAGFGASAGQFSSSTTGFIVMSSASVTAANLYSGAVTLSNLTGNVWTAQAGGFTSSSGCQTNGGGSKTLAGVLDRVQVTTAGGVNTFDAGTINIMYE